MLRGGVKYEVIIAFIAFRFFLVRDGRVLLLDFRLLVRAMVYRVHTALETLIISLNRRYIINDICLRLAPPKRLHRTIRRILISPLRLHNDNSLHFDFLLLLHLLIFPFFLLSIQVTFFCLRLILFIRWHCGRINLMRRLLLLEGSLDPSFML